MMSVSNERVAAVLSSLGAKLHHDLDEIRVRAFDNLLSKLESRVVLPEQVASQPDIISALVHWLLRGPDASRLLDVIDLLTLLAPFTNLVRFGAIRAFQALKCDSTHPTMQARVDVALDAILAGGEPAQPLGPVVERCVDPLSARPLQPVTTIPDGPRQPPSRNLVNRYQAADPAPPESTIPIRTGSYSSVTAPTSADLVLLDRCPSAWRFPFVSLPRNDERLLFDLSVRLKSKDAVLVQDTLMAMRSTTVLDFPAEVFLQRPQIVLALFSLIASGHDLITDRLAADVLVAIVTELRSSLRLYADPTSRPPPSPPPIIDVGDSDIEEMQYPPRGRQSCCDGSVSEPMALRCNWSITYFADLCMDAIFNHSQSPLKFVVYAPVAVTLVTFTEWTDVRLEALAAIVRLYFSRQLLHSLHIALRFAIDVAHAAASVPDGLADALGDALCQDDPPLDSNLRADLFCMLSRREHGAAMAFAEANAIIASLANLTDEKPSAADIDKAVESIAHQPDLLPVVTDALLAHLPTTPSLTATLNRMILHPDSAISRFLLDRLASFVRSSEAPEFMAADSVLRSLVLDGRPPALAFLTEACSSHPAIFVSRLSPYRILIDMMSTGDASAAGLSHLSAQWLSDDERQASHLRNLFHNNAAIVQDARECLAEVAVAALFHQWDVDAESCKRAVAVVVYPFQLESIADPPSSASLAFTEVDVRNLIAIYRNFAQDAMLRGSAAEQLDRMFTSDIADMRHTRQLFELAEPILEQLRACSLDIAIGATETAPILLPTLRLLFLGVRATLRSPDDRITATSVCRALLPYVFHPDAVVRIRVAETVAIAVFHPRCQQVDGMTGPDPSPSRVWCPVPGAVPRLFSLPTGRVAFHIASPERSPESCPDPRVARMMLQCLRNKTAPAAFTSELAVRNLLERIESAQSMDALLAHVSLLQSCCLVDDAIKLVFRHMEWTAFFQRYFSVAPLSRHDDFIVIALMSCAFSAGADIVPILTGAVFPLMETRVNCAGIDVLLQLVPVIASGCDPGAYDADTFHGWLAAVSNPRHCFRALARASPTKPRPDLVTACVALLSQNRLPGSFDGAAATRAAVMLLSDIVHIGAIQPEILIPDPDAPSLRWMWRLITDRESAIRAAALHLLTVVDSDLRPIAEASAPTGADILSTATRHASDKTQAPIVRQAALDLLTTLGDSDSVHATAALIPTLLRADVVSPSYWLSLMYLADHLLLSANAETVKAQLFNHDSAGIVLNLLEPRNLEAAWTGYAARHCPKITSPEIWDKVEFPIAIDCSLGALAVLQHVIDDIASNSRVASCAVRLLAAVTARPVTLPCAQPVVSFLLQLDPVHLLAGFGGRLSIETLKQIALCLEADIRPLRCSACALVIVLCRQNPAVGDDIVDIAGDLFRRLVQLMLAALAKRTYYDDARLDPSALVSDDAELHAQALAHLASVVPPTCKAGLRFDGSLRLLIDHARFLYDIYVARRFVDANAATIVLDLERVLIGIKSLLFRCPIDLKAFMIDDLHLSELVLQLWRLNPDEYGALRAHLLHLIQNLIADHHPAKLVLAGLSKRAKRSGVLSGLIEIAIRTPSRLVLQCLQAFATYQDTLPILLRSGLAGALVRRLRSEKRITGASLWVLACMALSTPGQARVSQILIPDTLDVVLDAGRSPKCAKPAFTLLHNLAFYAPAKTSILGNTRTLTTLIEAIRSGNKAVAILASATLWSLIYDCQKGCAMMRQQLIDRRVSLMALGSQFQDPIRYNLEQVRLLIDSS